MNVQYYSSMSHRRRPGTVWRKPRRGLNYSFTYLRTVHATVDTKEGSFETTTQDIPQYKYTSQFLANYELENCPHDKTLESEAYGIRLCGRNCLE